MNNWKILKYTLLLFVLITNQVHGQEKGQLIKGIVYDLINSSPLWEASITNLRTNEKVQSTRDGSFQIKGQINDLLAIQQVGYILDTVFYYEPAIKRIYLSRDDKIIAIDEVLVKKLTDSRLEAEIRKAINDGRIVETSQNKGGLRLSPSRIFSKSAKNARSNLDVLKEEQSKRKVDRVITTTLVASLTPLNQEEIALFRERFRPSWDFVSKSSLEEIKIYILDSYKKYKE